MKRNRFLAMALVILLSAPVTAQSTKPVTVKPSLIEKVLKIPEGSIVDVELRNQEAYRGRIGGATREGFRLSYARNNGVYERKVTNEMVKSISRVQSGAGSQIQAPTIQERVLAIAVGAEVEVQLDDKTGLQGRMGDASAEGFTLEPATGGERRVLSFSGVTSIKSVEHSKPPTLKGVLIGIGVGFVLLVALAAKVGD